MACVAARVAPLADDAPEDSGLGGVVGADAEPPATSGDKAAPSTAPSASTSGSAAVALPAARRGSLTINTIVEAS